MSQQAKFDFEKIFVMFLIKLRIGTEEKIVSSSYYFQIEDKYIYILVRIHMKQIYFYSL